MALKNVVQAVEGEVKDPVEERMRCIAGGGKWNPETETCEYPEDPKLKGAVRIPPPEIITEEEKFKSYPSDFETLKSLAGERPMPKKYPYAASDFFIHLSHSGYHKSELDRKK